MKIIISSPNMFWGPDMKCLEAYKNDILLLQFEVQTINEEVDAIDVHVNFVGLGQVTGIGRSGRDYIEVKRHLSKILGYISRGEDVLVLADMNPQSVIIFDLLKRITDGRNFKLHFWGIYPLRFESRRRLSAYKELLGGYGRVRSMYLFFPDTYLEKVGRRTTMPQMLKMVRHDLESKLPEVMEAISGFKEDIFYFFDVRSNKYVDTKMRLKDAEDIGTANRVCRNRAEGQLKEIVSADDKAFIEQPDIRVNGKDICRKLRHMRRQFAKANGIPLTSPECGYEGVCAGTCPACDSELEYLYIMINNRNLKKPLYPYAETGMESSITIEDTNGHSMGQLKILKYEKKGQSESPYIRIPEFLLNKHNKGESDE